MWQRGVNRRSNSVLPKGGWLAAEDGDVDGVVARVASFPHGNIWASELCTWCPNYVCMYMLGWGDAAAAIESRCLYVRLSFVGASHRTSPFAMYRQAFAITVVAIHRHFSVRHTLYALSSVLYLSRCMCVDIGAQSSAPKCVFALAKANIASKHRFSSGHNDAIGMRKIK